MVKYPTIAHISKIYHMGELTFCVDEGETETFEVNSKLQVRVMKQIDSAKFLTIASQTTIPLVSMADKRWSYDS